MVAAVSQYVTLEATRKYAQILDQELNSGSPLTHSLGVATGLRDSLAYAPELGPEEPKISRQQMEQIFQEGIATNSVVGLRQIVCKLNRLA